MTNDPNEYSPILPFDITLGESFLIYQHMTYYRDRDLCNSIGICKISGNVYKYYTLTMTEPVMIGDQQPDSDEE